MIDAVRLLLEYPFLQRALLAALLVGLLASVLGVFVILRGMAMLGDGLAHVSFAGVALGLAFGVFPLALAFVFALLGALAIRELRTRGLARGDVAIGILFTAGLALGVVVVSTGRGFGVDVQGYLFGNLLAVTPADLVLVLVLAAVALAAVAWLHRAFLYVTLSEEAARLSGLPVRALDVAFTTLTAAAVVVAARVTGVLLVSALLVVPAASALRHARSFRHALGLSAFFAVASVLLGVLAAAEFGLPTGAAIALASGVLFVVSVAAGRVLPRPA